MTGFSELGSELGAHWFAISAGVLRPRQRDSASDHGVASAELEELARFVGSHARELAAGEESTHKAPEYVRGALLKSLLAKNQFISVPAELEAELDATFGRTLRAIRKLAATAATDWATLATALAPVLDEERQALRRLLARELAAEGVVCAEYPAELQLALLGLTLERISEPVLDVGCGEQALLVEYFRAQGLQAFGLDRHATGSQIVADWLEHDFAPASYGTIVSHQAFSLHFLNQHLRPGSGAERYAFKYMQLLRALRPGGSFIYAPGLPFMEQHLPAEWQIVRNPLPEPLRQQVRSVFRDLAGDVAYAARVTQTGAA
ncbi:MAG TPA: class I SAM-dependent methyltransferase [Polyangiaceae bacterium]|jgi:hypothetical protein|nr:class I SAM-dependent methyltransferase [Polyangiaceae bacterium]